MDPTLIGVVIVLALVLGAEFVNGLTDAPNAMATLVYTRVMPFSWAVVMAVVMNILGTLAGTEVAKTMGKGLVDPSTINMLTIGATLTALIIWGMITERFGIPTSESHALIAGLIGAALATAGPDSIVLSGLWKVGIGILAAIVISGLVGLGLTHLIKRLFENSPPGRSTRTFKYTLIIATAWNLFNHGLGDGQKFMGIFALVLLTGGFDSQFTIHTWVIVLCALTMGAGTAFCSKRIMSTLGERTVRNLQPWEATSASFSAASTIFVASLAGVPMSTTHAGLFSLVGAGYARSPQRVRWGEPLRVFKAAVITFPFCTLLAFIISYIFQMTYAWVI
jgi:inorganic phosphate transporter, PiT family